MKNKFRGASADAILLMLIKLVTILLGLAVTRLLSQYLSVYDYGTYSQILLIVSTVASVTILGMMDGVNYFYCSEGDVQKRESYISTIFTLQSVIGVLSGTVVMVLSAPLCNYFDNPDIGRLMIFAASLPLLQNLLGMFQILLVSVGKARMLAWRNLIVSLVRLAAVFAVILVVRNVAVILAATLIMDIAQIAFFALILRKNGCPIRFRSVDMRLFKRIIAYCAPMAVFTVVNTLNRDLDKYLISMWTDTETLAVYSNASKMLPFDIIMTSFCTVLLPEITRLVAEKQKQTASSLYRLFLEIAYISTSILCCAALAASPQLMQLLYSEKYLSGLSIFCIYIVVDLLRFTNITLILSAAGKTSALMLLGVGALGLNAVLNVLFYNLTGIIGAAIATLVTTAVMGVVLLLLGARELGARFGDFFDKTFLIIFIAENLILTPLLFAAQKWLSGMGLNYFAILVIVCFAYAAVMLTLNGKRLIRALKEVNRATKKSE